MKIQLKHASFTNSYSLMAVKNQTSLLVCNKYKLGKVWKYSVSYQGKLEFFSTWEDGKTRFDDILKTLLKESENMGTMKMLAYTQKDGFKEIDFSPDWPDGLDFSEWLILAGFKDKSDCNIGTPDHYNIDEYAGDKGILVAFSCEEFCQNILVENSADCFALRLKLLPILHKNHIKEAELFLEEILMRIKQASHR